MVPFSRGPRRANVILRHHRAAAWRTDGPPGTMETPSQCSQGTRGNGAPTAALLRSAQQGLWCQALAAPSQGAGPRKPQVLLGAVPGPAALRGTGFACVEAHVRAAAPAETAKEGWTRVAMAPSPPLAPFPCSCRQTPGSAARRARGCPPGPDL